MDHERSTLTPAQQNTELATDRTMLAHERTLMAWTRTSISLISFGFTIYTFFSKFETSRTGGAAAGFSNYALVMIGIGLLSLVMATIQHMRDMKFAVATYGAKPHRLALLLAGMVSLLGIYGFVTVLFRL
jgi:putative membrane protein